MPKLILFAPCTKAIIDKVDNSLSLVGILHGITVNPPDEKNEPIPPDALTPFNWAIGSIWLRTSDDVDKTFEQRLEIITPDDKRLRTGSQPFRMTHRTHHLAMAANIFPVGVPGEYKILLLVREVGQEKWNEVSEYPIEIKHSKDPIIQKPGE